MNRDEFEKVPGHSSWQRIADDDCVDKIVPVSQCFSTRNTREILAILNVQKFVPLRFEYTSRRLTSGEFPRETITIFFDKEDHKLTFELTHEGVQLIWTP